MVAKQECFSLYLNRKAFHYAVFVALAISLAFIVMQHSRTRYIVFDQLRISKGANITEELNATSTARISKERYDTNKNQPPLIAVWQRPFGKKGYGPAAGDHCGCKFTYNRSLLMESDAVMLYCRDADKSNLPPDFPNRTLSQKYVWWCLEPPTHVKNWNVDLAYRRGFFNWTMSPRRDSDIRISWGFIDDVKSTLKKENLSIGYLMSLKNRTAIAIVSNCGSWRQGGARARFKMIKEMKEKGLDLDAFGKCFQNDLSRSRSLQSLRNYKFHLSFENSYHCRDYISEKFWSKGIGLGIVPVAWGARKEDYQAIAPNSSYIFVEDFDSIDELVKYLKYLDKNDTAYMQYLMWRSPDNLKDFTHEARIPPIATEFITGCELCRHLLRRRDLNDISSSIVPSVEEYYYDSKDKDCFRNPSNNETYWKYSTDN